MPKQKEVKPVKMWSFRLDLKKLLVWALVLLLFLPALFTWLNSGLQDVVVTPTQMMEDIKSGTIKSVEVTGDNLLLDYGEQQLKFSSKEAGVSFTEMLTQYEIDPGSVNFTVKNGSFFDKLGGILNVL